VGLIQYGIQRRIYKGRLIMAQANNRNQIVHAVSLHPKSSVSQRDGCDWSVKVSKQNESTI
jgi:hypothetical protein